MMRFIYKNILIMINIIKMSTQITFNGLKGNLINNDDCIFLNKVCKINTNSYDKIYKLDDGWTGSYLLINNKNYRYIQCGSGKPIISDETGTFN